MVGATVWLGRDLIGAITTASTTTAVWPPIAAAERPFNVTRWQAWTPPPPAPAPAEAAPAAVEAVPAPPWPAAAAAAASTRTCQTAGSPTRTCSRPPPPSSACSGRCTGRRPPPALRPLLARAAARPARTVAAVGGVGGVSVVGSRAQPEALSHALPGSPQQWRSSPRSMIVQATACKYTLENYAQYS